MYAPLPVRREFYVDKSKIVTGAPDERWEDRRDIKNLMGRYAYNHLIKNEKEIMKITGQMAVGMYA